MSEIRTDKWQWASSKDQLKDELHEMYRLMTDPGEQEKARMARQRQEAIKQMQEDYGI